MAACATVTAEHISFNDDLASNLDHADSVYCRIRSSIDSWIAKEGVETRAGRAWPLVGSQAPLKIPASISRPSLSPQLCGAPATSQIFAGLTYRFLMGLVSLRTTVA